ncbi:CBS domain-containing protein [Amycolatopsis alkalitolerans]|uniref:CBS domain-containing protein n=1 Tax=Amycolatopsis alkalitolerans TaxID=2547244 RepID=A0A5C4M1Y5_9PSEU|nr:CBS domain-containing protein [Amycolatopsis alkalitolerans]TNC24815.1 CBS domain-containing protein [Amycolatopsis alkalitolerans]
MRARDIMNSPAVVTHPETLVKSAEAALVQHGFTALPVVDDDDRLAGIVTEADFVEDRFPAEPKRVANTVDDIMTRQVKSVDINTDVAQLARMMLDEHLRCVPVLDRGKLAGVVTRRDFLRVLARPDKALAQDVRMRLAAFGDPARWVVDVRDGEVTIIDRFDSDRDREVAVVLAEGVPGVIRAQCYIGELERQEEK